MEYSVQIMKLVYNSMPVADSLGPKREEFT